MTINERIQELYKIINSICYQCDINISYRIVDDIIAYTEKQEDTTILHVPIWNDMVQRPYNTNSLLAILLDQLMLVTDNTNLQSTAIKLGHYNNNNSTESIIGIN